MLFNCRDVFPLNLTLTLNLYRVKITISDGYCRSEKRLEWNRQKGLLYPKSNVNVNVTLMG